MCWMSKATDTYSEYVISSYCSSTAKMFRPARLNITFIRTLLVLFMYLKDFIAFSNNAANNRRLSNISEYSMSFMGQITIQHVTFFV